MCRKWWCLASLLRCIAVCLSFVGALSLEDPASPSPRYRPPKQTQWQRELFSVIQKNAANRSKAAVPKLLEALDEPALRAELASCCPSVSNLSATELLEKLTEEIAYSEVVSAFVSDPSESFSLFSGMTMEDALHGSYFYNIWQRMVLDNLTSYAPLPVKASAALSSSKSLTLQSSSQNVTIAVWTAFSVQECADEPTLNAIVTIGTCRVVGPMSSPTVVGAVWAGTSNDTVVATFWDHMHESFDHSVAVPCPSKEPFATATIPATGKCSSVVLNTSSIFGGQDIAETSIYGLRPFKKHTHPSSIEEASERGFYSLINNYRIDQGSPLYGDVSVVFSSKVMHQVGIISSVDTGYVSLKCDSAGSPLSTPTFHLDVNCSKYGYFKSLGTFDHLNHVILDNHRFWQLLPGPSVLARHFARNEGGWGQNGLWHYDLITYLEVMPTGTFFYPEGIRFVIATFGNLFGSKQGWKVRRWAIKQGWILVWSLGLNRNSALVWPNIANNTDVNNTANHRIVDPLVALQTSAKEGLPLGPDSSEIFDKHWKQVERLRADPEHNTTLSNITWLEKWRSLARALPVGLQIEPLRPGVGCPRPGASGPECVGVTAHGACICYEPKSSPIVVV